uniref:Capsid protein n=1 Tax=Cressdnaviricota sp. TaxID=2748378 RepID=A0A6M4B6N0_9VIRU|nr:capsid protein [Cressdnaviricota sp.]
MYRRRGRYLYRDPDRGSSLGRPVEFAKEVERIAPLLQQNGYHLIGAEEGASWPMLLMGFQFRGVIYQLQDMEYSESSESVRIPGGSVMFYASFGGDWVYVGLIRTMKGMNKRVEGRHVYKVLPGVNGNCDVLMQGFIGERAIVFMRLNDEDTQDAYASHVAFPSEFVEPNLT